MSLNGFDLLAYAKYNRRCCQRRAQWFGVSCCLPVSRARHYVCVSGRRASSTSVSRSTDFALWMADLRKQQVGDSGFALPLLSMRASLMIGS